MMFGWVVIAMVRQRHVLEKPAPKRGRLWRRGGLSTAATHESEEEEIQVDEEALQQLILEKARAREQARLQDEEAPALESTNVDMVVDVNMEDVVRNFTLSMEDSLRYHEFAMKEVIRCPFIEPVELEPFGWRAEVEGLISQPWWDIIFSWRESTCMPILLEFIASLRCTKNPRELDQHSIKFRLFNRMRNISVDKLGVKLGLYTNREINTRAYRVLPTDFPRENVKLDFGPG